ncbi:MAG: 2-hydroxyacyl-CoA dehydratase [Chloroflexi bacterium]|nr:2-hydroxyacyl-CoA dehydratase [Chloroflexota bacterium]MBI3930525.1 2-hydroxyacyl-CoA dehydratase [Chloroflexota bacterium]
MEKFEDIYKNRHQYAKDWKAKTGGKILGYLCTYIPEEIVYAAGALPVRILGSHEIEDVTAPYIFPVFCPFCRDTLAQGLKGRYDYLDGIVSADTCMHINQTFDNWVLYCGIGRENAFIANTPANVAGPRARDYLAKENLEFKKHMEEWTGKTITNDDLDRGIEIMNRNRRLMKQVYETRKGEKPPITGAEAMLMVTASQFSDKEEHSNIVEQVLKKELPGRLSDRDPGVRLMIVGSEDDDIEFIRMVESKGATLVVDDHCTGTRYFWNEVIPGEDRLAAIANRYIDRTPCPVKDWSERRRFTQVLKLAQEYKVQGIILMQQKFCDPHEVDIPPLTVFLKEHNIPTYFLELDVTVPLGAFGTRVEAFLETIRGEELF